MIKHGAKFLEEIYDPFEELEVDIPSTPGMMKDWYNLFNLIVDKGYDKEKLRQKYPEVYSSSLDIQMKA